MGWQSFLKTRQYSRNVLISSVLQVGFENLRKKLERIERQPK